MKEGEKYIETSERRVTTFSILEKGTILCEKNTIIISIRASIGKVNILSMPACVGRGCSNLRLRDELHHSIDYFYYFFKCSKHYLEAMGEGSTIYEISTHKVQSLMLPILPLEEQKSISSYLDSKIELIRNLQRKYSCLLSAIEEYRNSIVSEVISRKEHHHEKVK